MSFILWLLIRFLFSSGFTNNVPRCSLLWIFPGVENTFLIYDFIFTSFGKFSTNFPSNTASASPKTPQLGVVCGAYTQPFHRAPSHVRPYYPSPLHNHPVQDQGWAPEVTDAEAEKMCQNITQLGGDQIIRQFLFVAF